MVELALARVDARLHGRGDLLGGGQLEPGVARQLEHDPQVLEVQPQRAARLEVLREHAGAVLGQHAAVGEAALQRLAHERRVGPGGARERQRLRDGLDVEGDDELVGGLGDLPRAGAADVGDARASASSAGRARSRSAASPPAMIVSVPSRAPLTPPETGASSAAAPRSRSAAASRRASAGGLVDMSTHSTPSRAAASVAASTVSGSGSSVITISAAAPTPSAEPPSVAPSATSASTGPRLRLCTTTPNPAASSRAAIGRPIRPSPITPTSMVSPYPVRSRPRAGLRGSGTVRRVTAEADSQAPLDPIAEAVRQWSLHDLGAIEHMEATTALMRMQQIIVARVDLELRPYNLTFPQYEALVLLHFSRDGALPLGRMGRRLMVHPATITNTVDQLEAKGFVKRRPHADDRRSVLAKITPKGRKLAVDASASLVDVKFGIADMTRDEAKTIADTVRRFRERIDDSV